MFVRPLALYLALTTLPAIAQNNFTITVRDKPAGKASYTIEKTKDGYHVKTKLSYHLSPAATPSPDADPPPPEAAPPPLPDVQQTSSSSRTTNSTPTAVTEAALSLTW